MHDLNLTIVAAFQNKCAGNIYEEIIPILNCLFHTQKKTLIQNSHF